jgi:ABC-type transporter lipoprotein component MlaA
MALSPTTYIHVRWLTVSASGLNMVNTTSLHIEEYDGLRSATLDPYAAMRSAYFEKHGK